ncbi:hypothetical protein [Sorangium sp. So ce887]|uniref:hypothetical protein n=1 Tax=Sorangium sp. So ce887 TaxID=3133324 RepID=UPI003F5E6B48
MPCNGIVDFLESCGDGILPDMTVDQIVAAIRALPVPDRLRVIELVAHEAASDVPGAEEPARRGGVTLTERHGLLLVDTDATVPADAFDHRPDRDARAGRIQGGS